MSGKGDKDKVDSSKGNRWRLKDGQGRVRAGSAGAIDEFFKRKRKSREWLEEDREGDEKKKIFQPSKKLLRLPTRKKSETEKDGEEKEG